MWQFSQTVDGLRDACLAFNTPITGGNVSFYNETSGMGIYPTPVVGMVGMVESESRLTTSCFRRPGDLLILLGSEAVGLGGSEYLEVFHGRVEGIPVPVDLALEVRVQRFLSKIVGRGWVESAHDCSEGGLLVTALESALTARPLLGFELSAGGDLSAHCALFGEGPSRVLLSVAEGNLHSLISLATEQGILIKTCGRVTSGSIRVVYNGNDLFSANSDEVSCTWDRALERFKFSGEVR
jgi:phosphoribosylformylglycinamidine synthase